MMIDTRNATRYFDTQWMRCPEIDDKSFDAKVSRIRTLDPPPSTADLNELMQMRVCPFCGDSMHSTDLSDETLLPLMTALATLDDPMDALQSIPGTSDLAIELGEFIAHTIPYCSDSVVDDLLELLDHGTPTNP